MTTFTRRENVPPRHGAAHHRRIHAIQPARCRGRNKVKITDIKAMQIKRIAGNCLIKIETDAGIAGYGEAG